MVCEVLMEPKRDWWSAAEGLLWLCVSRPRNLESGGFYLDKILQPKHLAGPFFTEGEATKNSIAECKALEGETNLVREYGWDATESFILARSLGRRGDRRFISEERLVPLGRSTWCRKPLLGLPSGSCPDYVLLYCAEHVKERRARCVGGRSEGFRRPRPGFSGPCFPMFSPLRRQVARSASRQASWQAVILGTSDGQSLWLMSRQHWLEGEVLQKMRDHLEKSGYDASRLTKVPQETVREGRTKDFAFRHDWNSLIDLKEESARTTPVTARSKELFPHASVLVDYLRDFALEQKDHIRYSTEVLKVRRTEDGFELKLVIGDAVCRELILATGFHRPRPADAKVDGSHLLLGYEALPASGEAFQGQAVLVLGQGNAALETAQEREHYTSEVHLLSRARTLPEGGHGVRFAYQTHYVGDIRAGRTTILDTYLLKSLDTFDFDALNGQHRLVILPCGGRLCLWSVQADDCLDRNCSKQHALGGQNLSYKLPVGTAAKDSDLHRRMKELSDRYPAETELEEVESSFWEGPNEQLSSDQLDAMGLDSRTDAVIRCFGWIFDSELLDPKTVPVNVTHHGKYPKITPAWEIKGVPGLYVAGTISHSLDFRKSAGGFIHGFRYTSRALFRSLEERNFGVAWPQQEWSIPLTCTPGTAAATCAAGAGASASAGWAAMFEFLGDMLLFEPNGTELSLRLLEEVPLLHFHERYQDSTKNPANVAVKALAEGRHWERAFAAVAIANKAKLRADAISYSAILSSSNLTWLNALRLLDCMAHSAVQKDQVLQAAVVSWCGKAARWQEAAELLKDAGLETSLLCSNAALQATSLAQQWRSAIEGRRGADRVTFNVALGSLAGPSGWRTAVQMWKDMKKQEVRSDLISHNTVIQVCHSPVVGLLDHFAQQRMCRSRQGLSSAVQRCGAAGAWPSALALEMAGRGRRLCSDATALNVLITALGRADKWQELRGLRGSIPKWALAVLEQFRSGMPLEVSVHNAAMTCCSKSSQWTLALHLFSELRAAGLQADLISASACVSAAAASSKWWWPGSEELRSPVSLLWALSVLAVSDRQVLHEATRAAARSWRGGGSRPRDAAIFLYSSALLGAEGPAQGRAMEVVRESELDLDLLEPLVKKELEGEPRLKVIGAGWGRTGTNSVKIALEKLLDGPCYHMFECVKRPDYQKWIDAYNGKEADWKGIFTHPDGDKFYVATVDYPACGLYNKLMEQYPDAKVLLTVRDPEKWYDSVIDTIWSWRCAEQNWSVRIFELGRKFQEQAQCFHQATMLPGKLLVFDVKEGWEPLCKFLGVPVPDEPFPNVNDREEIKKDMNKVIAASGTAAAACGISESGVRFFRSVARQAWRHAQELLITDHSSTSRDERGSWCFDAAGLKLLGIIFACQQAECLETLGRRAVGGVILWREPRQLYS
eukprot:g12255.t1